MVHAVNAQANTWELGVNCLAVRDKVVSDWPGQNRMRVNEKVHVVNAQTSSVCMLGVSSY